MAEPLKNQFGPEIPTRIARMIARTSAAFDQVAFVGEALDGYQDLALLPRGRQIAHALRHHLPEDYEAALAILLASLGPKLDRTEEFGMAPFLYLPHVFFVAAYGLEHFEASMQAQYELTQRFSAEFSIRAFIERHPERTLARLAAWTQDPSPHVRRLVSEGTRPRLPWAPRLEVFRQDPRPVLALLELLKDDPELYVRRSVANNLNDIGKDHPALLVETAGRWLIEASEARRSLVRHALRSALKRAEPGALALLGFAHSAGLRTTGESITPKRAKMGEAVTIAFDLINQTPHLQRVLVDFRIHFVKANGRNRPKVFKLKSTELGPLETQRMSKTISLTAMTTRRHYPGIHEVDVVLNGAVHPLGSFELCRE